MQYAPRLYAHNNTRIVRPEYAHNIRIVLLYTLQLYATFSLLYQKAFKPSHNPIVSAHIKIYEILHK